MPGISRLGRAVTVAFAVGSLIAGCTSSPAATEPAAGDPPASDRSAGGQTSSAGGSPSGSAHPHSSAPAAVPIAALRTGERWITLPMPGGAYRPQAEADGTDDYRCILLDPKITADSFLSGVVLQPGNPNLVHHAILYRVDPEQLGAAKAKDASDPRLGWSCFGGPGLPGNAANLGGLNSAPWVAAWATDGGEQRFAAGTGQRARAGTRVILQMHYNLLNGDGADSTIVKLRLAPRDAHLQPLHTLLLPAPVELPCAPKETGPLCDRDASVMDVVRRFGVNSGRVVAGLQLLCDGSFTNPKTGPTQSCGRPVTETLQLRAVAGHMHMLGRSVQIDLQRQDGTSQRLLNVKAWDFDDQRATVLPETLTVHAGDRLRVTCTHDAALRRMLPALAKLAPRYVVWGEGSSDEMCLGVVSYTKS